MNTEILNYVFPLPKNLPEKEIEFIDKIQMSLSDNDILYKFYLDTKINLKQNFNDDSALVAETIREWTIQYVKWFAKNHWNPTQ